jgi:hypothetical protein
MKNGKAETSPLSRRAFLAQAAVLVPKKDRLVIDTHLEVWTLDPKLSFRLLTPSGRT